MPVQAQPAEPGVIPREITVDSQPIQQRNSLRPYLRGLADVFSFHEGTASVLENFIPTRRGLVPRPGYIPHLTPAHPGDADARFRSLHSHSFGTTKPLLVMWDDLLQAYSGQNLLHSLDLTGTGTNAPKFSLASFQNVAGAFTVGCAGSNGGGAFRYDLANGFTKLTDSLITGVDPNKFIYVAAHRHRLFFIEENSADVWYLAIDSIQGAASKLPLGGLLPQGGNLLFMASWSVDSGSGLNDRIAFVSERGDVAVYSGDPGSDISIDGVYSIPVPLGRHAHVEFGGDVFLGTTHGMVSLSATVFREEGAVEPPFLSTLIEDRWDRLTAIHPPDDDWRAVYWAHRSMMFITHPGDGEYSPVLAYNSDVGAWFEVSGWNINSIAPAERQMFIGNGTSVYTAWRGGRDGTRRILHRVRGEFIPLSSAIEHTQVIGITTNWRVNDTVNDRLSVATDPAQDFPDAPSPVTCVADDDTARAIWDEAIWNTARWDIATAACIVAQPNSYSSNHRNVGVIGRFVAAEVQITSDDALPTDNILFQIDLRYQTTQLTGLSVTGPEIAR